MSRVLEFANILHYSFNLNGARWRSILLDSCITATATNPQVFTIKSVYNLFTLLLVPCSPINQFILVSRSTPLLLLSQALIPSPRTKEQNKINLSLAQHHPPLSKTQDAFPNPPLPHPRLYRPRNTLPRPIQLPHQHQHHNHRRLITSRRNVCIPHLSPY